LQIFRHGDRAPTDRVSNQSFISYFPNGLGELTNRGIANSYLLGTYLRDRYVSTGFLRTPILPSQIYFRSKANNRCLTSASLVANGMFNVDGKSLGAVAPVYSQEGKDWLLGGTLDCDAEVKRFVAICGHAPRRRYPNFTEFEGEVFECLKLHKNNTLFPDGKSFEMVDSLLNEYNNGLPMPDWFEEAKDDINRDFRKVENFIIGAAEYHDPDILRIKAGFLLHNVLDTLKKNWESFLTNGKLENKKFVAYSTQDWLIQSFMDSIGIRVAAVGEDGYPRYNSLIMLELRKINDVPVVKIFYRDPVQGTVSDVTSSIRGCKAQTACPLESVLSCCSLYVNSDPQDECYNKKAKRR
ncbi:histidine acid phosphatase, partial [Oesophagostomum dentatum]